MQGGGSILWKALHSLNERPLHGTVSPIEKHPPSKHIILVTIEWKQDCPPPRTSPNAPWRTCASQLCGGRGLVPLKVHCHQEHSKISTELHALAVPFTLWVQFLVHGLMDKKRSFQLCISNRS